MLMFRFAYWIEGMVFGLDARCERFIGVKKAPGRELLRFVK